VTINDRKLTATEILAIALRSVKIVPEPPNRPLWRPDPNSAPLPLQGNQNAR
jgi:hypothetical protein